MKVRMMAMGLAALLLSITAQVSFAQDRNLKTTGTNQTANMSMMQDSSCHRMGMAYRKNINNLATALSETAKSDNELNKGLIVSTISDIRSSFETFSRIRKEHMSQMTPEMKTSMAPMMEQMKTNMKELSDRIVALEALTKADVIDRSGLETNSAAIARLTSQHGMKMGGGSAMKMATKQKEKQKARQQ